jgi:hypothetical protein
VRLKAGPAHNARSKAAYLWRLQPVDSKIDTRAPAAPTELSFQEQAAGVELSWKAPEDNDELTYIVLRAEETADEYNTIARGVSGTTYTDNTAEEGMRYYYKVKAVDYAGNRSKASEEVTTSVKAPVVEKNANQGTWYDTNGLPATPATQGILIQEGKKVLKQR